MTTYIYIPIMTPEMATIANQWNQSRVTRNKQPYPIITVSDKGFRKSLRRRFGGGELADVDAGDKIYLLSHGLSTATSGGALAIGNKRGGQLQNGFVGGIQVVGGDMKMYRVDELARAIDKEGLTKNFRDLRVFCCNAGRDASHQGNAVQPFAQRLKSALVVRGYHNIIVTGYLGDLVASYSEFFAPGTTFVSGDAVAGIGLGVKIDGEAYVQDAKSHTVQF